MKKVASLLKVNLEDSEISTSHRLFDATDLSRPNNITNSQNSPNQIPPIIVRFINRDKRNETYTKRKLLNPKANSSPVIREGKIEIQENLTKKRKQLLNEAKKAKRSLYYKFLWTSRGKVFLR